MSIAGPLLYPERYADVVALITFRGASLVMVRRKKTKLYICIGGKREGEESDAQCLVREVEEETGAKLDPLSLSYFGQFEGPTDYRDDPVAYNEGRRIRITCYVSSTFDCHILSLTPLSEIEAIDGLNRHAGDETTTLGRMILAEAERQGYI